MHRSGSRASRFAHKVLSKGDFLRTDGVARVGVGLPTIAVGVAGGREGTVGVGQAFVKGVGADLDRSWRGDGIGVRGGKDGHDGESDFGKHLLSRSGESVWGVEGGN